jgi:hypothetical protein
MLLRFVKNNLGRTNIVRGFCVIQASLAIRGGHIPEKYNLNKKKKTQKSSVKFENVFSHYNFLLASWSTNSKNLGWQDHE